MKKIIPFSKLFLAAAIFSVTLTTAGVVSYFVMGGFNLGVDFQAGVIQEVQFAPTAFSLTWAGRGNATVAFDRSGMHIVNSGLGAESRTVSFLFSEYGTVGSLADALRSGAEGLEVKLNVSGDTNTQWLVRSAQGNPQLGSVPYAVHYLDPQSEEISIAAVRDAMGSLGQSVSVQSLGQPGDRHFMIRAEDKQKGEEDESAAGAPTERVTNALESYFGSGEVVVLRSDYVGSRFSKNLTDQVGLLVGLTLLIILVYVTVRFKPQYAVAAVIAILHDALIIVAFVVWTGMEFNTTTIAAILTIIGYSINNTIVVFDRVRENRRIYPDEVFVNVLNRSLTETLSRTIITTATTMLAVLSLIIFTTGSMRDFALALQVGMISGVYTTTFISSGVVNFWENQKTKKEKQKLAPAKV
ncbi:MAG: protein translocase subunit SecF [Treponema sp.]|nr:protein translocase subunit SecF [Treponema sp.]